MCPPGTLPTPAAPDRGHHTHLLVCTRVSPGSPAFSPGHSTVPQACHMAASHCPCSGNWGEGGSFPRRGGLCPSYGLGFSAGRSECPACFLPRGPRCPVEGPVHVHVCHCEQRRASPASGTSGLFSQEWTHLAPESAQTILTKCPPTVFQSCQAPHRWSPVRPE